ncbi:MAG TPA: hypothetical protein VND65_23195 [Candidatus Binatia bacterium]|nr:hypothetical protein [Candidatus Binatia bacterium]
MKKYSLALVMWLAMVGLAYAAVQLSVSGIGIGYGPDQSTADQEADQNAQQTMQNSCVGTVISSRKTSDQCGNLGSDDNPKYMCTVGYVGVCQVGR